MNSMNNTYIYVYFYILYIIYVICYMYICYIHYIYTCFGYREFGVEGDLVGIRHTRYFSCQSFITRLKLVRHGGLEKLRKRNLSVWIGHALANALQSEKVSLTDFFNNA